jgi:hypothetical protein
MNWWNWTFLLAFILRGERCAQGLGPRTHGPRPENLSHKPGAPSPALQEAAKWYARYYELAPDDLLGLKKLAEVCTRLEEAGVEDEACWKAAAQERGRWRMEGGEWKMEEGEWKGEDGESILHFPTSNFLSPAALLREELARRTDDLRIVAELLGVPMEAVELGPNLVVRRCGRWKR